jgi:hypothetical protein
MDSTDRIALVNSGTGGFRSARSECAGAAGGGGRYTAAGSGCVVIP